MAIKTTLAQIEEVQAAITKTLNMISYTIGDTSVQRASLKHLREYEKELKAEYNKEQGSTPAVSQAFFGNAGD
jgi:hypothetical protein